MTNHQLRESARTLSSLEQYTPLPAQPSDVCGDSCFVLANLESSEFSVIEEMFMILMMQLPVTLNDVFYQAQWTSC